MAHTWKHRTLICLSIVVLIVVLPITTVQSQSEGWTHGCDSAALPAIAATTSQLDYAAMCQEFLDCGGIWCWIEVLMSEDANCEDALCRKRVWLYSIAISVLHPNPLLGSAEADKLPDMILSALDAFEARDYAAAQNIYQSIPDEVSFHPLLKLSAGIAAEASGDDTMALAFYDESATYSETYPLVFYVRGNLFAKLDQAETAAADFATFRRYVASNAVTEALAEAHPINDLPFEDWLVYPVLISGIGPGGGWASDETLTPPRPVRLARIADTTRLVFESGPEFFLFDENPPNYLLHSPDANGVYQTSFDSVEMTYSWGANFTLDLNSQPATGTEFSRGFESHGAQYTLFALEGQPDPREQFDVFRCEGGAITRLKIGTRGYSLRFQGVPMMNEPAGQATGNIAGDLTANSTGFTVLQGPECVGDQAWWQVESNDNGAVGWIAENEGFEYRVLPVECAAYYADAADCMG